MANGGGLTWKNVVDVITLGVSVAGMGMAGASIAKSGKSLKAMYKGEKVVSNVATSNATKGVSAIAENAGPRKMDLQIFGKSGKIADKVYFVQKAVSPNFSCQGTFKGASIQSVSDKLIKGELSPDNLPIQYIVRDGKMITMNNRSLTVLSKANMKPSKLINITGNIIKEAKLTQCLAEMGGKPSESIFIRKIKEVVYIPD